MGKRDNFYLGLILGFAVPFVGYALFLSIYDGLESAGIITDLGRVSTFRNRTSAILAICLDAVLLQVLRKRKEFNTMRGVVLPSFLLMILWFFVFGLKLLAAE
ncbi:MAG: hypothetical protein ABIV51_00330 [Saprospiraceae bacterium]